MFGKAKNTDTRRVRQAEHPGRAQRVVFSYHASRSARGTDAGVAPRSAGSVPWLGASKTAKPRAPAKSWTKRARTLLVVVVLVTVLIFGVSLSRTPTVVTLADTAAEQVFLRSPDVYKQAARAALGKSLSSTNKLTIDTAHIASDLRQQFPELERVTVALPFFGRTPVIYVQPARPALLLRARGGGVFVLDTSGRALINASEARQVGKLGLPLVEDQSGLAITLGHTALPSGNVAFITEVVGQMKARKIVITDMSLPKGTSELDVHISGAAYLIKYNLRGDARAEAGAFMAVKASLERQHKTPDTYIDVRVDNKAYYR